MIEHYTYRVSWSTEDQEHVDLCAEFPSLSWLAKSPEEALNGIMKLVDEVVKGMQANNQSVPEAIADRDFSGEF